MTRSLLTGLAALAAYGFVSIMSGALLPAPLAYGANVLGLGCGYLAGRYVWARAGTASTDGMGRAALRGAIILGAIGFVGGFFGPMVFAPGANQGPLLGIFITGPAGALLGAIGGAVHWARHRKGGATPV